ncbi:MAG: hypothetical protein L6Q92_02675 [Phycisphaerae bacterium]|nr:hypothetical protein [Phycisphaerae bacterium]
MSCPSVSSDACRQSGVVLTCYVNGRKLFRAIRFDLPPARTVGDAHAPIPAAARRRSAGH